MEKILNFNSRYKVQLTPNRHSTLPPSYYTSSETKDVEKEVESPVFTRKKEDHNKIRQMQESALFSLKKVKTFDTDPSEPNTPELDNSKRNEKTPNPATNTKKLSYSKFKNLESPSIHNKVEGDTEPEIILNESSSDFTEINQRLTKISLTEFKNLEKNIEIQNEKEKEKEQQKKKEDEKEKEIETTLKFTSFSQCVETKEQGLSRFSEREKNEPERTKKKSITYLSSKKDRTQVIKEQHQKFIEGVNSEAKYGKFNEYQEKEKFINNHPFRHLIFGSQITESNFKRHLTLTYRGLVYAKKCLKGPSEKFIKTKEVNLSERIENLEKFITEIYLDSKKKLLFLDLDETLIHSCQLQENPQHILQVTLENGEKTPIGVNIRPYCAESLEKLSQIYDTYIFTASSQSYARTIINFIDPSSKYIKGILSRENCMETKIGFFIKDLRIIKNYDLKTMVIVDNLAHSFGFQIENGIPILEFHNDKHDRELKFLTNYLIEAETWNDLREFNKNRLRLNELAEMKIEDLAI